MRQSKTSYPTNHKVKRVTRVPAFILKLFGRLDAKKGAAVCETHLKRYLAKCLSIESEECKSHNDALRLIREEAAILVGVMCTTSNDNAVKPAEIYSNQQLFKAQSSALQRLAQIRAEIAIANNSLESRIHEIRQDTSVMVQAYLKGVRRVLPDFEMDITFSNEVLEKYYESRKSVDEAISDALNK